MYLFLLPLLIVILLALPVVARIKKIDEPAKAKNAILGNIASFFGVLVVCAFLPLGNFISAETAEAVATATGAMGSDGLGYLAAALAVGLGSIGCGIAIAAAAPAAIGAVSESPKSFSKSLIFVVLGEGVALYGFIIAFMIITALGG